jgi:cell division septum initiation protein DivIVA
MRKLTTAACALALGIAWGAAPGLAQNTTREAERKADQIEKQAEQKADRIESEAKDKARETRRQGDAAADGVRGKSGETVGDKMDRAWDRTKEKTREMADRITSNGKSAEVRAAQEALRDKGFDPGPIDGVMGPRTSAAVRDFQQQQNLTVTGQLDAETRSRLEASGAPAASPAAEQGASPRRQMQ